MYHPNTLIAQSWFAAFNAHDLEYLLSLYDDNAIHYSPKLKIRQPQTKGLIKGKEALRVWWQDAFDRLPTLQYEPVTFTSGEERVFMEYVRHLEGEEDLLVAEVLDIREGKIIASRVYHG
jgi:hypothetical protein